MVKALSLRASAIFSRFSTFPQSLHTARLPRWRGDAVQYRLYNHRAFVISLAQSERGIRSTILLGLLRCPL